MKGKELYIQHMNLKLEVKEVFRYWKLVLTERKFWVTTIILILGAFISVLISLTGLASLMKGAGGVVGGGEFLIFFSFLLSFVTLFVSSLFFSLISFLIRERGGEFPESYPKVPYGAIFGRFPVVLGSWLGIFLVTLLLGGIALIGIGLMEEKGTPGLVVLGLLTLYLLFYWFYVIYGKLGGSIGAPTFKRAFKELLSSLLDLKYFKKALNNHYFLNMLAVFGVLIVGAILLYGLEYLLANFILSLFPNLTLLILSQLVLDLLFSQIFSLLVVIGATFAHLSVDPPFNPLRG